MRIDPGGGAERLYPVPGGLLLTLGTGEEIRVTPSDPNKLDKRDFDQAPTENSTNLLTSGAVFAALALLLPKDSFVAFTGATGQAAGAAGIVPAPAAGTDRVLCSDGTWREVDDSPSEDSNHLVKSGGVWAAIQRGGGGGGTSNYDDLENRPEIGGITLTGDKTPAQLNLVAAEQGKGLSSNDFTTALKNVLQALSDLLVPANDGKVIGIADGALAAVEGGSTLEAWTGGSF